MVRIAHAYPWVLDPRLARIAVYVDGARLGILNVGEQKTFEINGTAPHQVRVRMWWYRSPIIELPAGSDASYDADIDRTGGLLRTMLRLALHPGSAMVLRNKLP